MLVKVARVNNNDGKVNNSVRVRGWEGQRDARWRLYFQPFPRWEYPDFWFRRFVPRAMVVVGSGRSPLGER